jgi:hypothetical protein
MQFQGGGFALDLPDGLVDASAYVFVANDESSSPPMLQITHRLVSKVPEDVGEYMQELLDQEQQAAPMLEIEETSVNQRDTWTYGIATLSWGPEPESLKERRIYLFVDEQPCRLFILAVKAPSVGFDAGNSLFADALRSFAPNDVQQMLPEQVLGDI